MWLACDYRQMAREVLQEAELAANPDSKETLLSIAKLYTHTALTLEGSVRSAIAA